MIRVAFLHYSASPVVGGVEAVMDAHAREFLKAGYPVTMISGQGEQVALPAGMRLERIPELDSLDPQNLALRTELEAGRVPDCFDRQVEAVTAALKPVLAPYEAVIVHNVLTKHFNLPLTAALHRLLDAGILRRTIAWCHDLSWTSPNSRSRVYPGYPWDLLRTYRPDVRYVAVSRERRAEMEAGLGFPNGSVRVVYNGVDPSSLLGLGPDSQALIERLGLLESPLNILMPVRVTQAKNIEFALQMAAVLKADGNLFRLVITGPPDPHEANGLAYYQDLLALRQRLGVDVETRFVYNSGPEPGIPYQISPEQVGDLYRLSDVMLMTSHREGFGMPVLEAGLAGVLVMSTGVPAAREIGEQEILSLALEKGPEMAAKHLLDALAGRPDISLRRRVRNRYIWEAIFRDEIEPLVRQ